MIAKIHYFGIGFIPKLGLSPRCAAYSSTVRVASGIGMISKSQYLSSQRESLTSFNDFSSKLLEVVEALLLIELAPWMRW